MPYGTIRKYDIYKTRQEDNVSEGKDEVKPA